MHSTRVGEPSDIAAHVTFLMSDEGEWINGQVHQRRIGSKYVVGHGLIGGQMWGIVATTVTNSSTAQPGWIETFW
jgi:hypothetical protein